MEKIISFRAKPQSVDTDNRILRGVILAKSGEAKGHGIHVDTKFLDELVKLLKDGAVCNFGHNYDNLGLQIGRIKNVRREADMVKGDLYIYENADKSPIRPNMGTWLMDQAKEDPESVMLSVRFKIAYHYQLSSNGTEIILPSDLYFAQIDPNKPLFVMPESIKSVDVVDDGAITDKMFSTETEKGFFSKLFKYFQSQEMTEKGAYISVGSKQFKADDIILLLNQVQELRNIDGEMRSKVDILTQKISTLETENAALRAAPAADLTKGDTASQQSKYFSVADKFNAAINASLKNKKNA